MRKFYHLVTKGHNFFFLKCVIFSFCLIESNRLEIYFLFGLLCIAPLRSTHSGSSFVSPLLYLTIWALSYPQTVAVPESRRLREAAVPQWSTTLPLSFHPSAAPFASSHLAELEIGESAGCGRSPREPGDRAATGGTALGTERLIGFKSAAGKKKNSVCFT